ncbi:hypothetical protein JKA73_11225 [Myxococcus xanthus]|nr:hypothetical protein JKA73_11225 [Myxococcus xanthus]
MREIAPGAYDGAMSARPDLQRLPYQGLWLDGFTLMGVPGRAQAHSDHHVVALEQGDFLLVDLIRTSPEEIPQTTSIRWRP